MKLGDDELRQIYQARTARGTRPDCPTADVFVTAAAGTVDADEKRRLADHLVACSNCAEEYRLVLSSARASAAEQAGPELPPRRRSTASDWVGLAAFSRSQRWRVAAAIALIAIATTASLIVWRANRRVDDSSERIRGGASVAIEVVPRDREVLSEPPRELSWSAVESADSYHVVVYDYQSTPVWESAPAAATSVAVPDSVRQQLQERGRVTYWRIIIQHGIESRSSELFQFTIRPQ